jgi:hypothetical protein
VELSHVWDSLFPEMTWQGNKSIAVL